MPIYTPENLIKFSTDFQEYLRAISRRGAVKTKEQSAKDDQTILFFEGMEKSLGGFPDLGLEPSSLNYYRILAPNMDSLILNWRMPIGGGEQDKIFGKSAHQQALENPDMSMMDILDKIRPERSAAVEAIAAAKTFRSAEELQLEEIYKIPFSEIEKKSEEQLKEMITAKVAETTKIVSDVETVNAFATVQDAIKSGRLSDAAIRILVRAENAKADRLEREQSEAMLVSIQKERDIAAKTIADILDPAKAAADRKEAEIAANLQGALDIIRRAKEQEEQIIAGIARRNAAAVARDAKADAEFIGAVQPEAAPEIPIFSNLESFARYIDASSAAIEETRQFTALNSEKTLEVFDKLLVKAGLPSDITIADIEKQEERIKEFQGSKYAKIYEDAQKLLAGEK